MNANVIYHRPRHLQYTVTRRFEIGTDCLDCPDGMPDARAICQDCGCVMVYRGVGRLRSGTLVHHFECVHSPREVHTASILISD